MSTELVIDWITDANTCFLLGAGCSRCAGKPLIGELTQKVKNDLSKNTKTILENLKGSYGRLATVEDLTNQLLQLHKLLSSQKNPEDDYWTPEKIEQEIGKIQKSIIAAIGNTWNGHEIHKKFIRRLTGQKSRKICDIFYLNYDTLIEASLEDLKLPYTDGFRGAENAYFDPTLYEERLDNGPFFRLFKLHGSINWVRDNDETVRRKPTKIIEEQHPYRVVVYPAEQKYIQTQYGIYETLLSYFKKRLREDRPNNKLVVLGYSFNDEHINAAIEDSILAEGSNLTVYAFVGQDEDVEAQVKRLKKMAETYNHRFNVLIGQHEYIGSALTPEDWKQLKDNDLWKFENLVKLITER